MNPTELVRLAKTALRRAYVPYSGYKVGAALLTKGGKGNTVSVIFTGFLSAIS